MENNMYFTGADTVLNKQVKKVTFILGILPLPLTASVTSFLLHCSSPQGGAALYDRKEM